MTKISGIYKITNIVNNIFYIGSSCDIIHRFSTHKSELRLNKHENSYLQNSWNKYGQENFIFEIIEECNIVSLEEREQFWLDKTLCYKRDIGYNIQPKSMHRQHSEETKRKIGIANQISQLNRAISEETKCRVYGNLKSCRLGCHHSDESKKKISANHSRYWSSHTMSEEHKNKIASSLTGKKRGKISEEQRQKLSESSTSKKPVLQIDRETNDIIKEFESCDVAAKEVNISPSGIAGVCRGRRKTSAGYKWKYK